jgi:hypothetical protein
MHQIAKGDDPGGHSVVVFAYAHLFGSDHEPGIHKEHFRGQPHSSLVENTSSGFIGDGVSRQFEGRRNQIVRSVRKFKLV